MSDKKPTMDPMKFRRKLQNILDQAADRDYHMEKAEVESFFQGDDLTEEQMNLVFDFLLSRRVVVEGYVKKEILPEKKEGEVLWSEEEQRWLDSYMEEIHQIPEAADGEWEELTQRLRAGDPGATKRAAELLLPAIVEEAKDMYVPGVHLSDVIQEGSLQLVLGLDRMDAGMVAGKEDIRAHLLAQIRESISAMIEEQKDVRTRDQRMVEKVEELKDGVSTLKEEYGRKVYLDEVADFMNITEEEAQDILKLAGEDVPEDTEGIDGQSLQNPGE
jgi:DNA-directed RNA polymerase sigma subunit (sigma70/sigma32)